MKSITLLFTVLLGLSSFSQDTDSLLQGKWNLFKIVDNMTGDEILPSHKSSEDYTYYVEVIGNSFKYNLEVNKCENEITVSKEGGIEFKYFSSCTKMCCDADFSALLTYAESTQYYIKENRTLILVSEDRIFYFSKEKEKLNIQPKDLKTTDKSNLRQKKTNPIKEKDNRHK